MLKSLTILFVALFALLVLAVSFHHHPDPGDHPSCMYCKLAKDVSSTEHTLQSLPDFPVSAVVIFARQSNERCLSFSSTIVNTRAPPA